LIPEEKVTPEELRELKTLKKEALSGECISFEDVLKKHRAILTGDQWGFYIQFTSKKRLDREVFIT
jgi:hypothetical protein